MCACCHIHTTRAHTLWPAAGSFANCVPDLKEMWGADVALFCLTGLGEENKSQQTRRGWGGGWRYKSLSPPFAAWKHTSDLSLHCMAMTTSSSCAEHTEQRPGLHPITLETPLPSLHHVLLSSLMCAPAIPTQEETQ